jgi:hypothetical protein
MKDDVTSDGKRLILNWHGLENEHRRLLERLDESEGHLNSAKTELARFMLSDDAQEGEVFNIWVSGGLLQVKKNTPVCHEIVWRQRPKEGFHN